VGSYELLTEVMGDQHMSHVSDMIQSFSSIIWSADGSCQGDLSRGVAEKTWVHCTFTVEKDHQGLNTHLQLIASSGQITLEIRISYRHEVPGSKVKQHEACSWGWRGKVKIRVSAMLKRKPKTQSLVGIVTETWSPQQRSRMAQSLFSGRRAKVRSRAKEIRSPDRSEVQLWWRTAQSWTCWWGYVGWGWWLRMSKIGSETLKWKLKTRSLAGIVTETQSPWQQSWTAWSLFLGWRVKVKASVNKIGSPYRHKVLGGYWDTKSLAAKLNSTKPVLGWGSNEQGGWTNVAEAESKGPWQRSEWHGESPADSKFFGSYRDTKSLAVWTNGMKPVLGKERVPGKALKKTQWRNLNDEETPEDMKLFRGSHRDLKFLWLKWTVRSLFVNAGYQVEATCRAEAESKGTWWQSVDKSPEDLKSFRGNHRDSKSLRLGWTAWSLFLGKGWAGRLKRWGWSWGDQ
jgi:hypothetical protein